MRRRKTILCIATFLLLCCGVAVYLDGCRNTLCVARLDIPLQNLPPELDGVKIVHLSDLHYKPPYDLYEDVLRRVNAERPDIIVITGDLIDDPRYADACIAFLGKLKAVHGKYAVRGNWEHWSRIDLKSFEASAANSGVVFLVNKNTVVDIGGKTLRIAGVDDPFTEHDDLVKACGGIPEGEPLILLAHSPEIIDKAAAAKMGLVLAGHTHGGQVCLPLIGPLYTPSPEMRTYSRGLFQKGGTRMYVNVGIGVSGTNFRFFCPPEITVITLRQKVAK